MNFVNSYEPPEMYCCFSVGYHVDLHSSFAD